MVEEVVLRRDHNPDDDPDRGTKGDSSAQHSLSLGMNMALPGGPRVGFGHC